MATLSGSLAVSLWQSWDPNPLSILLPTGAFQCTALKTGMRAQWPPSFPLSALSICTPHTNIRGLESRTTSSLCPQSQPLGVRSLCKSPLPCKLVLLFQTAHSSGLVFPSTSRPSPLCPGREGLLLGVPRWRARNVSSQGYLGHTHTVLSSGGSN